MSTQAKAKKHFRADIQGLRALAVVLVVAYHAGLSIPNVVEVGGGFVGVDMFFVISGFVVGGVLFRDIAQYNRIRLKRFFSRRARRLLPALGVMLAVTLLVSFFVIPLDSAEIVGWSALGAALFSANFVLYTQAVDYFGSSSHLNPLVHTWSLSVEEQFYVVLVLAFAASLVVARRLKLRPQPILLTVAVLLLIASFVYSVAEVGRDESLAFFSPLSRAWEFLAGVLLYSAWGWIERQPLAKFFSPLALVLGLGLVAYAAIFFTSSTVFPGVAALLPVLGTVLLIVAGAHSERSPLRWVFENRLAVLVGNLSYGWYLWHWPAIVFADYLSPGNDVLAVAVAVLALVPAWLSHRFLEKSSEAHRVSSVPALSGVAAVGIALPAVLALSFVELENRSYQLMERAEEYVALLGEQSLLAQIDSDRQATDEAFGERGEPIANADIVVLGDSHAAILGVGLGNLGAERGLTVGSNTAGDCLVLQDYSTGPQPGICVDWQNHVLSQAEQSEAAVVVIHGYSTGYLSGFKRGQPEDLQIYDPQNVRAEDPEEALGFYRLGLENAVARLVEAGKRVLIVSSVPDFANPLIQSVDYPTLWEVYADKFNDVVPDEVEQIPLAISQSRNAPTLDIELAIAAQYSTVSVLDLSPQICADGICSPWKDGQLLYWDSDHLSFANAERLALYVLDAIEALVEATG